MTDGRSILLQAQDAPPLLYHYTHATALIGILSQGRLRATNYLSHNDSSELVYGLRLASDEIKSRLVPSRSCQSAVLTQLQEALEQLRLEEIGAYYASFSENGNLLSHWRTYSGTQGFALGFRAIKNGTLQFRTVQDSPLRLCRVLYDTSEQRCAMRALLDHCEQCLEPIEVTEVLDDIITMASSMKHSGFREEREWRIMYHRNRLDDQHCDEIHVLAEHTDLISFVELLPQKGVLPIQRVTCGPGVYVTAARQALRILLHRMGYQNVEIQTSDIPAI